MVLDKPANTYETSTIKMPNLNRLVFHRRKQSVNKNCETIVDTDNTA